MHMNVVESRPVRKLAASLAEPREPKTILLRARALRMEGAHVEAINIYEKLLGRDATLDLVALAEAYDCFQEMPQSRYALYVSRYFDFGIAPTDAVLDIGSGHHPLPFATHLADKSTDDDRLGRAGAGFVNTKNLPVTECDVEDMMCFRDYQFDFVHCSHVLEHTSNPARACRELMRVARRGYIETPTRGKDLFLDCAKVSHHKWAVEQVHGVLSFVEYAPHEIEGLGSDILMKMHCAPETLREKAFSALVLLRAHLVNTMAMWVGDFDWEVRWKDGRIERSQDVTVNVPAIDHKKSDGAENPNTTDFYDALYAGKYVMGEVAVDWNYEAGDRMDWYRRVAALPFFAADGHFLDVGCGLGGLWSVLPEGPKRTLFGIDFSAVAIDKAKGRLKGHFVQGRAEAMPYPSEYFDRIACTETLEHVDDPSAVIQEMAHKLAPGGKLLITVPEETLDLDDHEWPGGVSLHINGFSIATLSQEIAAAGLRVESAVLDEREIWLVAVKSSEVRDPRIA